MFKRTNDIEFLVKTIVVTESNGESHFIKLISARDNEEALNTAFNEVSKLNK